jgi:hypothetical protein
MDKQDLPGGLLIAAPAIPPDILLQAWWIPLERMKQKLAMTTVLSC